MTISLSIVLQAASSGNYLDGCLDMLVSNFMPPYSFLDLLKQSRGLARKDQVLSRVHSTSEDISDLVPLVPSRLVPKVIQRMPNVFTEEPESSISIHYLEFIFHVYFGVLCWRFLFIILSCFTRPKKKKKWNSSFVTA